MTNNELQLIRDRSKEIESEKKMLEETKGLILELEKDPKTLVVLDEQLNNKQNNNNKLFFFILIFNFQNNSLIWL
jgi:hypothetical protein